MIFKKQNKLIFLTLINILILCGCTGLTYTSKVDDLRAKVSHKEIYDITCLTWASCYKKAETLCIDGYEITSKSSSLNLLPDIPHQMQFTCVDLTKNKKLQEGVSKELVPTENSFKVSPTNDNAGFKVKPANNSDIDNQLK